MREVYFSVDVETDGPIPGPHSMLSYGCAAFDEDARRIATFESNLLTLPGAAPDPDTMAWWGKPENAEAWKACRENPEDPASSMTRFIEWVESVPGVERGQHGGVKNAVFVAYPSGFDFTFMYWYMIRFAKRSPFSFSSLDTKTFAMALLGQRFRETTKKSFPKRWGSKRPHTHKALDDAIEQGELFMNMLRECRARASHEIDGSLITSCLGACSCGPRYDFEQCLRCGAREDLADNFLEVVGRLAQSLPDGLQRRFKVLAHVVLQAVDGDRAKATKGT